MMTRSARKRDDDLIARIRVKTRELDALSVMAWDMDRQDSKRIFAVYATLKYLREWTQEFDSFAQSTAYEAMKNGVMAHLMGIRCHLRKELLAFISAQSEVDVITCATLKEIVDTNEEEGDLTTLLAEANKIVQSMHF